MEPITLTLCLLVFAIVMFVWEKVPLAVTSMIVCVALVLSGVLNIKQAFAGFIDTNVILFVAMSSWVVRCSRPVWQTKWAASSRASRKQKNS